MGSEENKGDKFEGENYVNNSKLGTESLVTVDLFKRRNNTHFVRVSLRSDVRPEVITRSEIDMDKYTNEKEFLRVVGIAGAAIAESQDETYGDKHDPIECAKVAVEAASELLHNL